MANPGNAHRKLSIALVIIDLILVFVPLSAIVVWAFTAQWPWPDLVPQKLTDRAIIDLFGSSREIGAVLIQSIGIALAVAAFTTLFSALASRALAHYSFFGKEAFRFATVLPFLIPTTVFAMGVQVTFMRMGLASTIPGVILAHIIVASPYATMIMTDVTVAAGTRLEEQARVSGANPLQTLLHIQIPMLLPGILSAAAMSYIVSFSQYFLTLLIGGGRVKTFAMLMFPYLGGGDRTIASAYGIVFILVIFGVFLLFEVLLKRFAAHETDYFNG